jgi:maleate isomerase
MNRNREYGSQGRAGIAVPQANPVVEPEMAALLPTGVSALTTRLVSGEPDQRTRFLGYLENLEQTLKSYDTLKLDVLGFACTASSYLIGSKREQAFVGDLSDRVGYPIVTGGRAILYALAELAVRRVAIVAPYPQFVLDAGNAYLREAGIEPVVKHRVVTRTSDTRTIYELTSDDALAAAETLDLAGAECLLFTGTGMPTLRAMEALGGWIGIPVLSTNLCLAWAMTRVLGIKSPAGPHPLLNGWQQHLEGL